jgi:hypothetical protein
MTIDVLALFENWSVIRAIRSQSPAGPTVSEEPADTNGTPDAPEAPTTAEPASRSFRSPATENAFRRLEERLLAGTEGDRRTTIETLLDEAREKAVAGSEKDARPYGRSVEHAMKQMLIRMVHDLKKHDAPRPADTDGEPFPAPVAPDPPLDAAVDDSGSSLGSDAPYATGIDRTA